MQKLVVDTNVIVSALIQRSYPYLIVFDAFLGRKCSFCVSEDLMREYYEVLSRPKFAVFTDFHARAEVLLAHIEAAAEKYVTDHEVKLLSDPDDNMILSLAQASKADFVITGNSNHFTFSDFQGTRIVNPRTYWEILNLIS